MPDDKRSEKPAYAILCELENVAVNGRKIAFDVLKSVLAEKDVKITPIIFSRHFGGTPLRAALGALLQEQGKGRLSEDKLAGEIEKGVSLSVLDAAAKPNASFRKLAERAGTEGICIGGVTLLDAEAAVQLTTKLGLNEGGHPVVPLKKHAAQTDRRAEVDAWGKLVRSVGLSPLRCVSVTTCSRSMKAALAAGMQCVAVPDEFTSFQDYSGADVVLDEFNDEAIGEIFGLLDSGQ